jgi:hypothetical protein
MRDTIPAYTLFLEALTRRSLRPVLLPQDRLLLDALVSVPFCTTNRQLAARLHYSRRAVMNRVERLKRLTGCRNRAALAVWWIMQTIDITQNPC